MENRNEISKRGCWNKQNFGVEHGGVTHTCKTQHLEVEARVRLSGPVGENSQMTTEYIYVWYYYLDRMWDRTP